VYLQNGFGRLGDTPLKDQVVSGCIIRSISVPFRKDFNDFRQEVRKAIGRYVTFRSDGGRTLDSLLNAEPNLLPFIRDQHNSC